MITYQSENVGKSYDYRSNCHTDWVVPLHIHEYSEIAFTKQGCTCVYLDGKKYLVPEKHLIFISPNQLHEYTDESPSLMRCAVFSNDFIPIFHTIMKEKDFLYPVFDFSDHIEVLEELDKTEPSKLSKICGLLNIVADILLEKGVIVPKSKANQRQYSFQQIINYISSNFREDIKLYDIAKRLGYHEKYLSGALHALTGMNFRRFLASYRIDYAKKLLRDNSLTTMSIVDIALQCGFSSINSFNRLFLSICGMTPTQYKNQYIKA